MLRNIFVLGLDEVNLATLQELPGADRYHFHQLLTIEEMQHEDDIRLPDLLAKAERQLAAFDGPLDGVVGYWDFPVSSMVPILAARFGLRSASLESVLKCEHKYWSRLEQQKVIEEYPRFALVDLDSTDVQRPPLSYPFWLKPVKSFSSELAFYVTTDDEFHAAANEIRDRGGRVGEPFEFVLSHVDLPPEVAGAGGTACMAEEAMTGQQVTIEGYSLDDDVTVYGAIDSLCYPDTTSFLRFQYPSSLPSDVIDRMSDIARRVILQVGLDASTFNVEFFWDAEDDTISLLEVNPRHSQSHAHLFTDVDGMPNHKCMVELALGERPQLPYREGEYGVAAKWFLRRFADGVVRRAPSGDELAAIEKELGGTTIDLVAHEGQRLSELWDQDSYSYKLANVYIGAADTDELVAKYERCVDALPFTIDDAADPGQDDPGQD